MLWQIHFILVPRLYPNYLILKEMCVSFLKVFFSIIYFISCNHLERFLPFNYWLCFYIRNQILIAKRLIKDGTNLWKVMSPNNHHIPWENAVYEIQEQFMKIACCGSRSLSPQVYIFYLLEESYCYVLWKLLNVGNHLDIWRIV